MSSLSTTPAQKTISHFYYIVHEVHETRRREGSKGSETSEEAQPLGQDVGGLGLDQDLPAVQRHAGAHLSAHVEHGRLLLVGEGGARARSGER